MNTKPWNTQQHLAAVHSQRQSLAGVLHYHLQSSADKCNFFHNGIASNTETVRCISLLLKYANKEYTLRQRILQKSKRFIPRLVSRLSKPWCLQYQDANGKLQFEISHKTLIGRGEYCDLVLPLPDISRKHVILAPQPDGSLLVKDLGSTNGTLINGQAVKEGVLRMGDALQLGAYAFVML
jgi:hypothetical protein